MRGRSWLARLSIANLILLGLVFVLGAWVAEDTPFTTVIAYAPPAPWLIPGIILFLFSLRKTNRRWLPLNGIGLAVFGWLLLGVKVPMGADRSGPEGSFSLLTFNMMGGQEGFEGVRQIIREQNPDVVCLQESGVLGIPGFQDNQIDGYHLTNFNGTAIASKEKPIRSEAVPLFPGSPEAVEVEFANGLRVVAVHMAFHRLGSVGKGSIPGHLQEVSKIHEIQIDVLASRYGGRPKVVIAGDFNCPPRGHIYSRMRQHFADAFDAAGWLTGYTWPSQFPLQRIDYAFTTDVKVQSARTVSSSVSNHLPVFFRFKI